MYCPYVNCCCFFCTVWSTLIRISLTKALVLWWCDNKSDLIWFDTHVSLKYYCVLFLVDEQSDSNSQHKIACWSCVWFSYIKSTDYPIQLLVTGLTASNWKKKSSGLLSTASVSALTSTIGLSNWALSREAWAWFWPSASTGIRNWARLDSSVTWSQTHPKINTSLCHSKPVRSSVEHMLKV